MSRIKNFAKAIASGYILTAANILYTFASVPLALHYLGEEQFGLWAVTSSIAGYLMLFDLGLSSAVMRILIDYKDHRRDSRYGSVIQTSMLVNAVQAVMMAGCGCGLSLVLARFLNVPPELARTFFWLMIWQSLLAAFSTAFRTPAMILTAHQRYDVVNLSQAAVFLLNLGLLWWWFRRGIGIYSMIYSQALAQVLGCLTAVIGCWRLRLTPSRGCWGKPSLARFRELFSYGWDMFVFTLGYLLINSSQAILITRVLGLEAGAIWSVCTRAFVLINQFLSRLCESSTAAFAEMIVRGERGQLLVRFRSLVILSASAGFVAATFFAAANQAFVQVWTNARLGWPGLNDVLLALWLVVLVLVRFHMGLVGLAKDFRRMQYLYFLEGCIDIGAGYLALRYYGVTGLLFVSLLASLVLSFPYSIWRSATYFQLPLATVALDWLKPALRMGVVLLPLAAWMSWLVRPVPPVLQFVVQSLVLGGVGAFLLLRCGIDQATRDYLLQRVPAWGRKLLVRITGSSQAAG